MDLGEAASLEIAAHAEEGESEDGAPLDDVPAERLSALLRARLRERGYLHLRASHVGLDRDAGPTEAPTPGHALLDVGAGWLSAARDEGGRVEVRFLVRNVLDRLHPASPDERSAAAPGRSALLTFVAPAGG